MKFERLILITFLGNFVVNNVAGGLASLIPPSPSRGLLSGQYIAFVILAAITIGIFAWWYSRGARLSLMQGIYFGVGGFVVSILTTLVSGLSGVLLQTGSFSQMLGILPNFGPFLWQWTTLIMLGFWVIPAALVAWLFGMKKASSSSSMPRPMI